MTLFSKLKAGQLVLVRGKDDKEAYEVEWVREKKVLVRYYGKSKLHVSMSAEELFEWLEREGVSEAPVEAVKRFDEPKKPAKASKPSPKKPAPKKKVK